MPVFSIVIPHHKDHGGLSSTLKAISAQVLPAGWELDVIVVDNAEWISEPDLRHLILRHGPPCTKLLQEAKLGAAHARNTGFSVAAGALVAFLDCDCTLGPDWIEQAVRALTQYDVVGGPVVVEIHGSAPQTPAEAVDLLFGFNSRLGFSRDGLLLTANIVTHRDVFLAVGPFRGHLSEDRDWCKRATARGYRLGLDEALSVRHAAVSCERKLRARWSRVTVETYHFLREYGHGNVHWIGYLARVAASPLVHVLRVFTDPRTSACTLQFKIQTALTLFRLRWFRVRKGVEVARGT